MTLDQIKIIFSKTILDQIKIIFIVISEIGKTNTEVTRLNKDKHSQT
jgi:hypothetical protein